MHEASLMGDLMARIAAAAATQGDPAPRVTAVSVWLGALSHFSPGHFEEHFRIASRGTLAEGARLDIECSDEIHHPQAQGVLLRSIEVSEA